MTQPTVGRVVWFWPASDEQLALPRFGQPLAAHVAAVSEDGGTVNLQVIDANGYAHARQDVPFFDGGHPGGQSYADWMPYQRAQHAQRAKQDAEHPDPAPLGCIGFSEPVGDGGGGIKMPTEQSEPPLFYTTQPGPDTNYETVTTPSDGAKPEFANTSAN